MTLDPSRWGTVKDAANKSGLSEMTIRRYINAGTLPARRMGVKLIRVDMEAVENVLLRPFEPTEASANVD